MRKSRPLTAEVLTKRGADRLAALLLDTADHDAVLISRGVACPTTVTRIKQEERAPALPIASAEPVLRPIDAARQALAGPTPDQTAMLFQRQHTSASTAAQRI